MPPHALGGAVPPSSAQSPRVSTTRGGGPSGDGFRGRGTAVAGFSLAMLAHLLARDARRASRTLDSMPNSTTVTKFTWNDMPKERVTNRIDRRVVAGESTMVAHVYLEKGAIVPEHAHHNEQITYILKGKLRFWVGDDLSQVFDVAEGEVLHLPSNVPHKAEALEETLDVDIFSPPRQDWLNHTTSVPHFQDHASDNWKPEGAGSDGVVNRSWSGRRSNMLSWSTCSIW